MKGKLNVIYQGNSEKKKAIKFVVIVFILMLGAIAFTTNTWAGDTFRFKGQSADAFFVSFDSTGCIETDVFAFAGDSVSHEPPGPPSFISFALFGISQIDFCTDPPTLILSADCSTTASLADSDFQVKKLDSATLEATLECSDFVSSSSFNVDVDLVWTGTGDLVSESSHFHFRSPGFSFNSRSRGTFRSAEVSGTVSDGTTNFTPNPTSGNIRSVKNGSVVVD